MITYTLFVGNVESNAHPPVGALIHKEQPQMVLLQQAERAKSYLRMIPGYRALGFLFSREAKALKTLVRKDVKVKKKRALRMRLPWIGPKSGRRHLGRVYTAIRTDGMWVLNIHFPSGGPKGPNAKAWTESARRIVRFVKRHPNSPMAIAGDFNATASELKELAREIGAQLHTGGKVDHAMTIDLKVISVRRNIPKPNNVHGWFLISFKKENA